MSLETRISDFLKNHHIHPEAQTSRSYIFDCPACGGDKKLYVQKEDGRSVCFKQKSERCPKPGSYATYALSLLANLPIDVVKREILEYVSQLSDDISVSFDDPEQPAEEPLPAGSLPIDTVMIDNPLAEDGANYLIGRGIPLEIQKKYDILYVPSMRRVVFPVIMDKTLYGWQGRAIDKVDHAFRMHNMEGIWRARTLMFYNSIKNKDFAILAEGPISALKFDKVGNFVASMGKEVSRKQLQLLKESGIKKLYLALDRDAVDKLHSIMHHMNSIAGNKIHFYLIEVPEHRDDFGDCTFEECEAAFQSAKELSGDELFTHVEFKLSRYE